MTIPHLRLIVPPGWYYPGDILIALHLAYDRIAAITQHYGSTDLQRRLVSGVDSQELVHVIEGDWFTVEERMLDAMGGAGANPPV